MIYVEMYGRLGNQFFRYAAARAVQLELYPKEDLCFNFSQIEKAKLLDNSFFNVLPFFNVTHYSLYSKKGSVIKNETSLMQKIICAFYYEGLKKFSPDKMNDQLKYQMTWKSRLNHYGIYWYRTGYCPIEESKCKNKFLSGNFESPLYFKKIREILLKELQPKAEFQKLNLPLMKEITNSNSVCISVRRGDFQKNETVKELHNVCNKQYFMNSIFKMASMISSPTFFFFSDDIEWVKNNIHIPFPCFYESGSDPIWSKIKMMSSCKNFIISNSTFSWWAQWLSKYEKKIVISPAHWFNNDYICPLIEENFITI